MNLPVFFRRDSSYFDLNKAVTSKKKFGIYITTVTTGILDPKTSLITVSSATKINFYFLYQSEGKKMGFIFQRPIVKA